MCPSKIGLAFVIFILIVVAALPACAQTPLPQPSQVELDDIKDTIVTLYYYNPATQTKGEIVPLPENQNPQCIQWDYTKAAPGTYEFYKVPFGTYYIEAVHGNNSYFALATVGEGTTTANVAIPPENGTGSQWALVSPTPSATATPPPAPVTSSSPSSSASPSSSPGMTTISALAGLTLVALYVICKKK